MRSLLRICVLLALPIGAVSAQTPAAPRTITIGRIDSLWSPTLKENRNYIVYTPPGYAQSPYLPRAYPVLYLLDGDAHFHSVTGLFQFLSTGINGTFVVPEMIVVAIPNTNRTRDLSPTKATVGPDGAPMPAFASGGGGPNFLKFIKTELIPHVDSTLRTESYRILVGHSLGGITAIDALYTMPETFNAYVAIDPSLWWDDQILLKRAKDYFAKPAPAARALFVGQANTLAETDTVPNLHFRSIRQFDTLMAQPSNKSGIRYAFKYYSGDDHGSVPLIAEYDALRFIFDSYKLDVQKAARRPALIAEHFAKVSAALGYRVLPPEKFVDRIAGFDTSKTVAVLSLNTELYPKSTHAFQVLGSALLARRDTTRARAALAHALELDPGNQPAKNALAGISVVKPETMR
jgi:predicted alpha/beta superfamily hydrolase